MNDDHTYRLYNLSREGAIRGAESGSFRDDAEAIGRARQLLQHHQAVEIWQTDRLVGLLRQDQGYTDAQTRA